jgi:hypothetical protein
MTMAAVADESDCGYQTPVSCRGANHSQEYANNIYMNNLENGEIDLKYGEMDLIDGEMDLKDGEFDLKDGEMGLKDGEMDLKDGEFDLKDGEFDLKRGGEIDLKNRENLYEELPSGSETCPPTECGYSGDLKAGSGTPPPLPFRRMVPVSSSRGHRRGALLLGVLVLVILGVTGIVIYTSTREEGARPELQTGLQAGLYY